MNITCLVKVIIYWVLKYYNLLHSIVSNKNILFMSKFEFLLYELFNIKYKLPNTFYD